MKKLLLLSFLIYTFTFSQIINHEYFTKEREVYFKFKLYSKEDLKFLSRIISIDKIKNDTVYAYANENEFNNLMTTGYTDYIILPHPGDVPDIKMSSDVTELLGWDSYPTYDAYVQMMNQFQTSYPNICKVVDAGTTVQGRKILFCKISDNVNQNEAEPQVMLSSTMHGDEVTGFVLMLRLIDSLLTSYGNDTRITNIIDNIEIWINPNTNPDGTYYGGNNTVSNARRYNGNSIDINRNFPDPAAGNHPDGNAWQPETITMMNLGQSKRFVLSANIHGGAEVMNYPWDTWSRLHPDDAWFIYASKCYVDTVHKFSPSTYMDDLYGYPNIPGITNGYAWYTITGGKQDYFTYFLRGREITIEISNTKLPAGSQLPTYWNYNRRSFLDYIEKCLYGIKGVVTDQFGNPVKAKVTVIGNDFDNSEIFSDSLTGHYVRMIKPGTYSLKFEANNCITQIVDNVTTSYFTTTPLNIQLISSIPVELVSFNASVVNNKVELNWCTFTEKNNKGFEVQRTSTKNDWKTLAFVNGNGTTTEKHNYSFRDEETFTGKCSYRLKQIDYNGSYQYSYVVEVEANNTNYVLEQNYPNPFNPETRINFSLPAQSNVSLKIFDVLGNEVKTLINGVMESGNHSILFNANDLGSGVYFYELKANNFTKKLKMLLTK